MINSLGFQLMWGDIFYNFAQFGRSLNARHVISESAKYVQV